MVTGTDRSLKSTFLETPCIIGYRLLGQVYEEKHEDSIRGKAQQEIPQWSRGKKTKTSTIRLEFQLCHKRLKPNPYQ